MFRNLFRRGIPVLVLTLALFGSAPAAATELSFLDRWDGMWRWVVSIWSSDETDDDRGLGLDPNGLTIGDRGAELDPNGSTTDEEDRGAGLDPNG